MRKDQDWDDLQTYRTSQLGSAGSGVIRLALLFGSAAVALGLIIAPLAENGLGSRSARNDLSGIDFTSTGSIGTAGTYTVRRSVLQSSPNAVCIIRDNGQQYGDCR